MSEKGESEREEVVCVIGEVFEVGVWVWELVAFEGRGTELVQRGTHDGGQVRGVLGLLRNGGGRSVVRRKESKAKQRTGKGRGKGRARVRVVGLGICSWGSLRCLFKFSGWLLLLLERSE